jgi:hypothetical protein
MRIRRSLGLTLVVCLILGNGMALADVFYRLSPGSTFQEGCVGPCLCPVGLAEAVTGTFLLVPAGADPLFTNYKLDEISWTALDPNGGITHKITGRGTYRVGGEFALTHQLVLDISIDGANPQHLDSNLIPGGSEFPLIDIAVSRQTPCFDIWMDIKAAKTEDLPTAVLENPTGNQKVSGILPIYGWALDPKGIARIELFIDGQLIGNIPYGGVRPDVKQSYPDFPDAENSGFAMIWNYSTLGPGDHSIKVKVYNREGQTKDLEAPVTVKTFHGDFVDKMNPSKRLLRNNSVTADGTTQRYNIEIEWSDALQGFEIIDIIHK